MNPQTLYQRVLGKDFSKLPTILQQFHSLPEGGCADGIIAVERGAGVLRHIAAQVLRLPSAGKKVPLRLQVIPEDGKEIWIRHFDGQSLKTIQWQDGSYLVEKAGPLQFVFQLAADEHGLTFHPHPNRIGGIQVPECISLRVSANARSLGNCWNIEVIITAPLLGTITTYKGEVIPRLC